MYEEGFTTRKEKTNLIRHTSMYEEAERRLRELQEIRGETQARIAKAPPGRIHVVNARGRAQYYLRKEESDKSGEYIPKVEIPTIKTYLQKSYDEKALKLLNTEIKSLETYLRKSYKITERIQNIYSQSCTEVKQYTDPIDVSDEDYARAWLRVPFKGKELGEGLPFYETDRKERVRSKSELTIANALAKRGIPYRYECPLKLENGTIVYPDFTALNVAERRVLYWEHRGMMDDREYAKQAVFKVKSMARNGIIPGRDLIITEETGANPLGTDEVEAMIEAYLTSGTRAGARYKKTG